MSAHHKVDDLYIPTDWEAQCDALCRKSGKRCPHKCRSQIPNVIAGHHVMDRDFYQVLGRPVRLCSTHARSWHLRCKRLLSLPLIDHGHLMAYNHYGYGSIVAKQDRVFWSPDNSIVHKIIIPKMWGVARWKGNVPEGLLERLPKYEI